MQHQLSYEHIHCKQCELTMNLARHETRGLFLHFNLSNVCKFRCNWQIYYKYRLQLRPTERLAKLEPKGCYLYVSNDRPPADPFANLLGIEQITTRLDQILNQCARVAKDEGYEYFAIHNYGKCYREGENYTRHGESAHCLNFANKLRYGVGKENSSFVYKLSTAMTTTTTTTTTPTTTPTPSVK